MVAPPGSSWEWGLTVYANVVSDRLQVAVSDAGLRNGSPAMANVVCRNDNAISAGASAIPEEDQLLTQAYLSHIPAPLQPLRSIE
jgi:hypothetical protein